MKYSNYLNPTVPQSEKLDENQVKNNAGGFAYKLSNLKQLERFLILGTEGGTYYVSEKKLSIDNIKTIKKCVEENGLEVVKKIVEISDAGRAPKNDPALLALALCFKHGDKETKNAARLALPKVARIGTHMFHFAEYLKALEVGWGRGNSRAFSNWYNNMELNQLVTQAIKYQSRDGWSHRDLLRLSHPKTNDESRKIIYDWMCRGWNEIGKEPHPNEVLSRIWAFEMAKKSTGSKLIKLIEEYKLPHECVPNEAKNDPDIWNAMLPSMGITAVLRNLGKMSQVGILGPLSKNAKFVCDSLRNVELLKKGRVHPIQILTALMVYKSGHGVKGSLSWHPNSVICDALDDAFYLSFGLVEPTNKRHLLALDVSGSMDMGTVSGVPGLTPRVASAAMSMMAARTEKEHHFVGFTGNIENLKITSKQSLDTVCKYISKFQFGPTDCAQPMLWALENKVEVDAFVVYTDNETWFGKVHPSAALKTYRNKMGINSKLIVCGMTANQFSIADPNDYGMMDVVGFDSSCPAIMSNFVKES